MTTWPEVADTALKMGLPALVAGLVAIFVSRTGRSHEFERERRSRKQDCLERAIEDFDECDLAVNEFCVMSRTEASFSSDPDLQLRVLSGESLNLAVDKMEEAQVKLLRSRSKLVVLGFNECAEALTAYEFALAKEKVSLQPVQMGKANANQDSAAAHEARIIQGGAFCAAVEKAFRQL